MKETLNAFVPVERAKDGRISQVNNLLENATQRADLYHENVANRKKPDEGGSGDTGHESGPDIPGREEPDRVRPEKSKRSSQEDERAR